MGAGLERSIDRAISLMKTPADYEKYISIKIQPVIGGCCCSHCWPATWNAINRYIYPCGPIEHEGDILIGKDDEQFVLESHESGPEIVVYIGAVSVSLVLIKSIIDLVTTLLKARQDDFRGNSANFRILKRRQIKGQIEEEEVMEVKLPLSKNTIKKLNDNITNAVEKRKESNN